jgi:hypothetical protein
VIGVLGTGRSGGDLLDADEVPGGVAHGAVADAVVLVDGLLDDVGAGGLERGEGRLEVGRGEVRAEVGALGDERRAACSASVIPLPSSTGWSTKAVSGCPTGPTVIQRMGPPPTSRRTSKPSTSR